jgi:hypothetical protein
MVLRVSRALPIAVTLAFCLAAVGCISKPKAAGSPLRRVAAAMEELATLMTSVQDPDSALAAVPEMKTAFQELTDAANAFATQGQQQAGGLAGLAGAIALGKDLQKAQLALDREFKRLDDLQGLPAEFWDVARVETIRFAAALAPASPGNPMAGAITELAALYDQLGPRKIIEVRLRNTFYEPDMPAIAKLAELAGPSAQTVAHVNPEDSLETVVSVGPVEDFSGFVAKIDFGEIVEQEEAPREIIIHMPDEVVEPLVEEPVVEETPEVDPAIVEAERLAKEEAEKAAAEVRRIAEERARLEVMLTQPDRAGAAGHAQLAKLLADKQSEHHGRAVEALARLDPAKVADKKLRTEIAREFRTLATSPDANETSIRGLINWGGKFSGPILVAMVKNGQMSNKQALFEGLATYPTAEGAEAVFAQLAAGGDREAAAAALSKMGPVAEDAMLPKLPAESAEVNLASVKVLGDVGTAKSIAILRRATKSENEEIKEAALEAVRKIRAREAKEKSTAGQEAA